MITFVKIVRKVHYHFMRMRIIYHRKNILKQINGGYSLHLEGLINVIYPRNLTLGANVHIGADAYINCRGGITIGEHTILSRRVTIYSYDHNIKSPTRLPYDSKVILKPVNIGKYVWVGMNVTITPGTVIGDGAIIGMGTVVSGIIPENAIVVGAKTRIIGYRDPFLTKNLTDQGLFYRLQEESNEIEDSN